ncbi:MAG: hypothetical protein WBX01_05030 [Nitrososphaeraceae archaeon]
MRAAYGVPEPIAMGSVTGGNRTDATIYPVRIDSGGIPHVEENRNDIIGE